MTYFCPACETPDARPVELDDLGLRHPSLEMRCVRCAHTWMPNVPTEPAPDFEQLQRWDNEGRAESTDGCTVEPDGVCPHGYKSWLVHEGFI